MNRSPSARRVVGFLAWLVSFHILLAYGLPEGLFISLAVLLGILYWRAGTMAAVTVSITLVMVTVLYGITLKLTGLEDSIYYRPDEKYVRFDYANNHRIYQKNVHVDMHMPHGDLRAMTTEDIAEPRRIQFDTDSEGFRNEQAYHGQRYLLVGDSFIAGNSNTQGDLLYKQLLRDHGIDTYSLAYPGSPADYAAYINGFKKRHGENFRALVFMFEGNDFEESRGRKASWLARRGRQYYEMFSGFSTYRVTSSLIKRVTRARSIQAGSDLDVVELGGKKMAFYQLYNDVTRRTQVPNPEGFERAIESMRPHIERIYFIPTNYRVYYKHLNQTEILPDAQWRYLDGVCRKYQLRCTNLTAPLVKESDSLLKQNELTWWRDDTHWNRHGIAAAARVVAADLAPAKPTAKR